MPPRQNGLSRARFVLPYGTLSSIIHIVLKGTLLECDVGLMRRMERGWSAGVEHTGESVGPAVGKALQAGVLRVAGSFAG